MHRRTTTKRTATTAYGSMSIIFVLCGFIRTYIVSFQFCYFVHCAISVGIESFYSSMNPFRICVVFSFKLDYYYHLLTLVHIIYTFRRKPSTFNYILLCFILYLLCIALLVSGRVFLLLGIN